MQEGRRRTKLRTAFGGRESILIVEDEEMIMKIGEPSHGAWLSSFDCEGRVLKGETADEEEGSKGSNCVHGESLLC